MNPLLDAQLLRLRANIHALQAQRAEVIQELNHARAENERLTKTIFRHEGDKQTLQLNMREYGEMKQRLKRWEEASAEMAERSERMAKLAAALAESLEP